MVKPKAGLQLRKIGSQYMIVKVCDGNVNMSDVFTLNETAARLWEKMAGEDCTPEELAGWLCEEYEVDFGRETYSRSLPINFYEDSCTCYLSAGVGTLMRS